MTAAKASILLGGREEVDVERPSLRLSPSPAYVEEVRRTIWVAVCRVLRQEDFVTGSAVAVLEIRGAVELA